MYTRLVFLVCTAILPLASQEQPVIRVTVDLVQVDAVVTDSQGRHVGNLKPGDFRVLEDGKPQIITHFSYVQASTPNIAEPARPALKQSRERPAEPVPAPVPELQRNQVHRTIVLIADDLGLSADDISNVRKVMKNFVDAQMQPGDLVSIMTTSGGMGALEQLTNDQRQLYASINRIHYVQGRVGQTWYEPANIGDAARAVQTESNARLNAVRAPAKASDTLGAVAYAIQGLREMPGRKAIAVFSGGFEQSTGRIVELANRASVVLYTFDPRGVASFFLTAVDVCAACAAGDHVQRIRDAEGTREARYRASQRSLEQMARGTGGIFFHDNNDLGRGLANALDDMSSYYLIGYQPQREDFERVRGVAAFHHIEVKVLVPGLQVRSRNGFAGTPDEAAVRSDSSQPSAKDELRKALLSPFHANGFPVHLSAFYSASTAREAKTNRHSTIIRAMLAIDARQLRFAGGPGSERRLELEVIAAAFGPDDRTIVQTDRTFTAVVQPDEMDRITASGLVYGLDTEVPKPGPYQLRIAAFDRNAQRTGSASTFIEVPDFNKAEIAMSSILLADPDAGRDERLTRAGVIGAGSPVTRVFASGAVLKYDCTVFGALIDRRTGKPRIEIEVRLFRGPEQIFTGRPVPLAVAEGNSTEAIHAAGEIRLPATLPPGDYAVELSAYDRLGRQPSPHAVQWSDFTLVDTEPNR